MTGRLEAGTLLLVFAFVLLAGPLAFLSLRRFGVSTRTSTGLAGGAVGLGVALLCGLTVLLGARAWDASASWGGTDWAFWARTSTTIWWWPLAAAGVLVASRPPRSWEQGASVTVIALATAWTSVAATPGAVAAGLVMFCVGICIEHRGGRLRIVACALVAAWVVLDLGADARAIGIEAPTLDSLSDVARPYAREVSLVWIAAVCCVGLIPAQLGEGAGRSGASHLLALTLACLLMVRVFAPALALGFGEWAQVVAWPALALMAIAACRAGTEDEHAGAFGIAAGLVALGVSSLSAAGLGGASAVPALLGAGLVARSVAGESALGRIAVPFSLSVGAVACIAAVFGSRSTFETPGLLAVLALAILGLSWAGVARHGERRAPTSGRALGSVVLVTLLAGLPGTLDAASQERRVQAQAIARTRCLRLESREATGLSLVRSKASCSDPDLELRARYRVEGHELPGGGS